MKLKHFTKVLLSLLLIICNIGCDQISKEKARTNIDEHEIIQVVDDNFILTKVENTGAALSLGGDLSPTLKIIFLQALPLFVLALLFVAIVTKKEITQLNTIAFSFIIGGGIGNIYDRVLYNSVTDFMYMEVGVLHTGVFNMADVSVVVGTLLLLLNWVVNDLLKKRLQINEA